MDLRSDTNALVLLVVGIFSVRLLNVCLKSLIVNEVIFYKILCLNTRVYVWRLAAVDVSKNTVGNGKSISS